MRDNDFVISDANNDSPPLNTIIPDNLLPYLKLYWFHGTEFELIPWKNEKLVVRQ